MEDIKPNGSDANGVVTPPTPSENKDNQQPQTVPYDRFAQVNTEKKALEDKVAAYEAEKKSPSVLPQGDEPWKRKIELEISVPTYLKDKVDDMTAYWAKNPGMNKTEVFKVFTPIEKLVEEAKRVEQEATESRTGGNSSGTRTEITKPYADTDSDDIKQAKLRASLESHIKSGGKV